MEKKLQFLSKQNISRKKLGTTKTDFQNLAQKSIFYPIFGAKKKDDSFVILMTQIRQFHQ